MHTITTVLEDRLIKNLGVSYVGIINKQGRLEDFICKKEILLDEGKKEMFCMCVKLQNSMDDDFNDDLGPLYHTVKERGNLKFASIPANSHIILAVMNRNIDHVKVIDEIRHVINESLIQITKPRILA